MPVKIKVANSRIWFYGVPKHSPTFGSMPSARWNKKEMAWTYFASPVAAQRLLMAFDRLEMEVDWDDGFQDLLIGFAAIKDANIWKAPEGIKAVEEMLAAEGMNPFETETTPWVHQVCADCFLLGKDAGMLAMEMGTGKTLVVIQQILTRKPMKTLVVAPLAVCEVWPEEWKDHAGPAGDRHVLEFLYAPTSARRAEMLEKANLLATVQNRPLIAIINYESFWRPAIEKEILSTGFDMVVYDEIHKLKSPSGKASKFAARLAWLVRQRFGLSGTPIPNNPLDGFGVWRALDPSMYGTTYTPYRNLYAKMGGFEGREVVGWINQDRFKRIMDFATYRVDIDVLNLPEATDVVRHVQLSNEVLVSYKQLEKNFILETQTGVVTASNALARLMKLREVTCGFIMDEDHVLTDIHHEREVVLKEVLEEIDREKVVIFCEFKEDVERIKVVCDSLKLRFGEVTGDQKDTVGGKFPPDTEVLICNTRSGGLGLNLVAARFAIFYSVGFSLSDHLQARRRVHRGGQYRTVTNIHLVAPGTIDEKVYQALVEKKKVIDFILDDIKKGIK